MDKDETKSTKSTATKESETESVGVVEELESPVNVGTLVQVEVTDEPNNFETDEDEDEDEVDVDVEVPSEDDLLSLTLTEDELGRAVSDLDLSLASEEAAQENAAEAEHSDDCSTCGPPEFNPEQEIEKILRDMNNKNNRYDWSTIVIRAGITTFLYPNQMAQILMQVGYEPYPPRRSVTLLGRPCLLLPSTGGYLRYIYQVDGIMGVFHGLSLRILHQLMYTYVFDTARCQFRTMHVHGLIARARAKDQAAAAARAAGLEIDEPPSTHDSEDSDSLCTPTFWDHFRETTHDLGAKLIAITVTYPVHVIVVRTVCQFVGREHIVRPGLLDEIKSIYCDFGLSGFFKGLVPKLLGETCQTLTVCALAYIVTNQAPGAEIRSLLNLSFSIIVSAWTYQFNVLSTTMAVNGSSLVAGNPPMQTVYKDWLHCWKDLGALNVLNRGSSIICRYYTGPTHLINGLRVPHGLHFGPNHLLPPKSMLVLSRGGWHELQAGYNFYVYEMLVRLGKPTFQYTCEASAKSAYSYVF